MNEEIKAKIEEYGRLKQEENDIKKKTASLNAEIKTYMGEHNLDTFETDEYTANYSFRKQEDLDEDKLIAVFKEHLKDKAYELGIIKTKEVIDMNAIEKAGYAGTISEEVLVAMGKCKMTKHTPYLTIKKKGGK